MDIKDKRKNQEITKSFIQTVSFAGGSRLASRSPLRRRIWIFIIIVVFVCLSYNITNVVLEYRKYPTNSMVRNYLIGFRFPDVTICNNLPFSARKMKHLPEGIGIDKAQRFWRYLLKETAYVDMYVEAAPPSELDIFKAAMLSFRTYANDHNIYSLIMDNIYYCHYRGFPCNLEDFKVVNVSRRLKCITFIPPSREIFSADRDSGLQLILYKGDSYTNYSSLDDLFENNNGYEVATHEPGTIAHMEKDAITVDSGTQVIVRLIMKNYTKINTFQSPCSTEEEFNQKIQHLSGFKRHMSPLWPLSANITDGDCLGYIHNVHLSSTCNCTDDSLVLPWNVNSTTPMCHRIPRYFFYNTDIDFSSGILKYKDNMTYNLRNNNEFLEIVNRRKCFDESYSDFTLFVSQFESLCPRLCSRSVYDQQITIRNWPTSKDIIQTIKNYQTASFRSFDSDNLFSNVNDSILSLSSIIIYPRDVSVDETIECLAYPWSQLLADFGGFIGLWAGMSFLTVVEIIEFFIRSIRQKFSNPVNENP